MHRARMAAVVAGILSASPGAAQQVARVSVDTSGAEADGPCIATLISSDGCSVLLVSTATNLVANDTNGVQDLFVHDRISGTTECVSVDPSGVPGNKSSGDFLGFVLVPSISADGRFVSFESDATNLVAGITTSGSQIFVRDRAAGVTELVSVNSSGSSGNGACENSSVSADGRFVAFDSLASDLVPGDTNGATDVFLRDRVTGTTERISISSSGTQGSQGGYLPFVSADGGLVSFSSGSSDLVSNDKNRVDDAFVRDRTNSTTERVSVDSNGVEGNKTSYARGFSVDGHIIMIVSLASNFVTGDTNQSADVFVRDRITGIIERVSIDSAGGESNGLSDGLMMSSDGNVVAFRSEASNLVAGDTNGVSDAFIHDRVSGATSRVSLDAFGAEANDNCYGVTITADGRTTAYSSLATNIVGGDTNGVMDGFVHDDHVASWSNYDAGFPGTAGIPSLTSNGSPSIGTSVGIDVDNSYQNPTVGVIVVGLQRAHVHSALGGDLLVVPTFVVPINFSFGGDSFTWSIPDDFSILGAVLDLQALEVDPGAAKGVSFSRGLEIVIGI